MAEVGGQGREAAIGSNGSPSSPAFENGVRGGWEGRWKGAGLELDIGPDQVPCPIAPPLLSLLAPPPSATDH